jgi:hypothetical protein
MGPTLPSSFIEPSRDKFKCTLSAHFDFLALSCPSICRETLRTSGKTNSFDGTSARGWGIMYILLLMFSRTE